MTVPSEVSKAGPYHGDNVATVFGFDFKIIDASHLQVIVRDSQGDEHTLVFGADYSVSGVGGEGGSVTKMTPLASGSDLTILRNVPFVQETDLENQGAYYAETVEDAFDLAAMRDQQLKEELGRAVKMPENLDPSGLSDLVADIIRLGDSADNIDIVANNVDDVNAVAGSIANVNTVANNIAAVNTVATNIDDVNTVASIAGNVNTVAGDHDEIVALAAITGNINTVAGIATDVSAVASISGDVQTVADNIADIENFARMYLGPKESDPATRNDGTALQPGDLYFNTMTKQLKTFDGAAWQSVTDQSLNMSDKSFAGDGSQTSFTLDLDPLVDRNVIVWVGGVRQVPGVDYTVSGATLTLSTSPGGGVAVDTLVVATTSKLYAPADGTVVEPSLSAALSNTLQKAVSTISQMKAIDVARYKFAFLGDNHRAGVFELKAGAIPFADAQEAIFVSSNTAGYYWKRIIADDGILAVWFGVVGDDAGDHNAAINGAIQMAKNLGLRSVVLPDGVVRHNGSINIDTGYISIRGGGIGATTLRRTDLTSSRFVLSTGVSSVTIRDMSLDVLGNGIVTAGAEFYVEKGNNIFFENLVVSGGFYGAYLVGCFNVHLDNVSMSYGGTTPDNRIGIYIQRAGDGTRGGNIFVDSCNVMTALGSAGTPGASYGLFCDVIDGLFVSNSYFGYFASSAIALTNQVNDWLTGVHIDACWLDHAQGNGLTLNGSTGANFGNIRLSDCTIWGGVNSDYSIRVEGNPTDVAITGNRISWVNGDLIRLNSTGSGFVVSDNILSLADADDAGGGAAVFIAGGQDFTIAGNVIKGEGKTDNGIQIAGGSRLAISGNRVRGCVNGILTQGAVNVYTITGNNCWDNSGANIADGASGTNKSLSGNL